ncbi:hypothetical protein [Cyclobacterium plantarum]|uniref:Transposase n=1 Tax=Cyclobacterium plantarum TaxID=2716263 RepID=A0ABX0HCY7_9BACT|nr:hypothetical protein [Cyclobacterium plantarum]NHE58352.1 hypothetical protein [Cyclobacterium plantarum]
MEEFGCRKPENIFQEYYSHVLVMNMVLLAGIAASVGKKKNTKNRKWAYKYNWKNAFGQLRASMVELFSTECSGKLLTALEDKITLSVIASKKGVLGRSAVRSKKILWHGGLTHPHIFKGLGIS